MGPTQHFTPTRYAHTKIDLLSLGAEVHTLSHRVLCASKGWRRARVVPVLGGGRRGNIYLQDALRCWRIKRAGVCQLG